jgi:hypothetical protein
MTGIVPAFSVNSVNGRRPYPCPVRRSVVQGEFDPDGPITPRDGFALHANCRFRKPHPRLHRDRVLDHWWRTMLANLGRGQIDGRGTNHDLVDGLLREVRSVAPVRPHPPRLEYTFESRFPSYAAMLHGNAVRKPVREPARADPQGLTPCDAPAR